MESVFTISPEVMVILLFQTLITGQANTVVYRKVGDEVVLSPGSEASPVSRITWKHNSDLAVVWNEGGTIDFFSSFRGHCELNTTTGELIIPELTLKDSGSYTAVINNRVLKPTEIKVISGVSKPTVSENCDAEKTHCVLTCEGITTDSEPVTYTWWSGDVMKNKTNQLIITKDDTEPSFTCELENPVSSERSREVLNPLIPENNSNGLYRLFLSLGLDPGLGLGLSVVLVLAAVGVVIAGVFIYKRRTGKKPNNSGDQPDHIDLTENPSAKTGEEESSADSQSPASHLNASDQSDTKSETEEEQETTTEQQQSGSPSVVSDHHEKKPLLPGNNGEVQVLTSLDHINETEPSYPPAGPPRRTSLPDPSDKPEGEIKSDKDEARNKPVELNNSQSLCHFTSHHIRDISRPSSFY